MPLASDTLQFDLLSADPGSPVEGQVWYNTTTQQLKLRLSGSTFVLSGGGGGSTLVQTAFAEVSVNTTTTSTSFVDLLTINLTTGANFLLIQAAGASSMASANINFNFRLLVDGVSVGGVQNRSPSAANIAVGFSLLERVSVTAAAHVIKLQWRVNSSTGQIRPLGNVDGEKASLLVQEVTV